MFSCSTISPFIIPLEASFSTRGAIFSATFFGKMVLWPTEDAEEVREKDEEKASLADNGSNIKNQ
jgi:hypothetical protein